ncbi:Uncharacterised protein [Mycobacteroides abscessus subsp. abscessus]|nr:Uncharacterised protein [Mycobacteroides abscessus subsp. abscessus]
MGIQMRRLNIDHRVKGLVGKRQVLGISLNELQAR